MPNSKITQRRPSPSSTACPQPDRLVAIARNGWSRSIGTTGRNQSEQVVAITRCAHSATGATRLAWGPWQFWWICPLMMLVMFAVALAIFLAFHRSAGGGHHVLPWWRNPHESALQILNERFARGEIDQTGILEERRRLLQA